MNQVYNCKITHLEIVGRLIKVWVQHNPKMSQDITTTLMNLKDKLVYSEPVQSLEQLNRNSVYIAKNSDGNYFRCNVVGVSNTSPKIVNVYFIDFGSVHSVLLNELITLNPDYCTQYSILKCPGQASEYYLSSVAVKPRAISDHELDWLKSLTLDCEFPCSMSEGLYNIRMISIMIDHNIELSHLLVQKDLAQIVSRDDICEMGKDYMKMNYSSSAPYSGMNTITNPNLSKYQPVQTNSKIEIVSAQSSNIRKPSMPIYQPPPVYQQQVSSTFQQRYIIPKDKLVNLMSYPPPAIKKPFEYSITVGSAYQMYVSHVQDGPLQFSLQLKQYADEVLPYLSLKLNATALQKFTSALTIGMHVIGMHPPDKTLRRAMLINADSNTCTVYYVDLGSNETLPHSNIFQLPPSLSISQIPEVAINFALKGFDSSQVTDTVKSGFRELVMSKVVLAKVMTEGPVRTCELFVDGRDVKTLMTHFNQPPQYLRQLPPRKDVSVVVSYVESPQQIFVQYKSELPALTAIVDTMKSVCSLQKEILNINSLTIGKPVLSLYSSDNHWYRAQVMEIAKDQTVTVLYVDYGNKEIMTAATLREMKPELISKWRCQAVECCLEGFEYILPSELLATKLEEKILSEEVTLKMRSLLSADRLLVDLIDSSGNSIAAYLKEIHNNQVADSQKSLAIADSSSFREPVVERNVEIDYVQEEPKPVRVKKEDSFKKPKSRDSDEDATTKWKSKDSQEDVSSSSGKKKPDDRWNSKDSHDDRRKSKDSYDDKWKSKDSHDDRWKSKDSQDDRWKSKDSHDDRWKSKDSRDDKWKSKDSQEDKWKSKDSHDDRWKSKDSHDDRWKSKDSQEDKWKSKDSHDDRWKSKDSQDDKWKSKDSHDDRWKSKDSHDDRWKSKDSHDDRWKSKDSHDDRWKSKDSHDDRWKSKDSHDDRWKSKDDKFRGGGDGDTYKRNDKWSDNKPKGKDDKWKSGGGKSDWDDSRGSKYNKEERFTVGPKKNDWNRKDGGSASGGGKKWEDDNRKGRGEFKWKDSKNLNEYDSKDSSKTLYSDGATNDKSTTRDDYASTSDIKFNPKVKEYIGWDLGGKTTLTVSLSHIETPERFYVKTPEADVELERLRDLIDSDEYAMSRILPPRAVNVGTPVLAVYSEDELLYRAVIDKVNNKTVNVLFVDYGNSSEVPSTELYYPSDNLARLPMAVVCCCLNNVKPSGGPWTTDNDELVKCFGGYSELTMTIENVKLVDGMPVHYVNLTVIESGKDVAQILIDAGLAKSASGRTSISTLQTQESIEPASTLPLSLAEDSPCEEVWIERLELLVGQFLLAKVVSIVSSEAILVKLDATNLIVIGFSPDINTSALQIGDNVIIHVHCVLEDRLRVTVYDKVGFVAGDTKRELPEINAICPMPIVRSRFRVIIPHCEQSFVYTQKVSDADRISEMLDSLFTFYEETKPTNKEFVVNSFCAVKSADENWYRAKVIKRNGDSYTIRFIDYGNTEEIDSSRVRKLDSQFNFPELAFKAQFKLKWKMMDEDIDLMSYVEGKEFVASFVKIDAQNWHICLEDDNKKSLAEELVKLGKADHYKTCSFHELNTVIGDNIVSGDKIPVTVTHVESPELFWIQMVKHIQTVESMQAKVQTFSDGKTDSDCGVFAAKYSADDLWYRAVCIDPDNPAVVRFIDYGNTDSVCDKKELPHLMTKPRSGYAVKMCLCAVPKDGQWSQEALNMFEEFIDANEVIAEIVSVSYKIVADLTKDDKSISSMLIESGLAVYEDFTPSIIKDYLSLPQPQIQNINVYFCHTLSVNDFCVLDVNREPELEEFAEELKKIKSTTPIVRPKPGDLVLAKYPDDGCWYRAKIIQTDPLTVLYTDFGNSSEVDEIGQLPTELNQTPPFAVHCSLGYDSESDLALDKFLELSDGGKNVFTMTIVKPGDPNIVKLSLNDSNIIDLLPKIQKTSVNIDGMICFVTHFNSFDDFYVQLHEDTRVDNVIDELTAVESFSEVDKTCVGLLVAAEFPEDSTWYRAKVISLEPLTVLFYDYGNVSEVSKVKELPPDLKLIPALSYRCSLEKPSSILNWTDSMADSFQDLISQELPFTIKLMKGGSTNRVDLLTDNQSVCDLISCDTNHEVTSATIVMESMILQEEDISDKIITLSFVNSVDDFYVNLEDDCNLENLLTERLTHGNLFDDSNDVSVGDIIATPSPVLGDWLRAKVICLDPLTVYFIDEGSTSSEVHNIKILPQGLSIKDIKPLAYHCSLKKPDSITTWPETLIDLEEMMTQSTDKFKIKVHSKGNPYDVSLYLDGSDVISKLGSNFMNVSYTSVESPSVNTSPISSTYNNKSVFICYGESVDNFYVQNVEDSDKLSEVTNTLSNSMTFSRVANLQIGSLVSAKCPADNLWYRGKVIATEPNTQVLFVDYGNSSNALMVKELPEKMKNIPPLVLHCSLKLPNNIKTWTEEAKEKFIELISSVGESIYTIKIEETRDPAIVSLTKDGKDLADIILGIMEISNSDSNGTFTMNNKIAIISHVNKLDEFYVQLFDDADKINNVIEKLLEGDSFEKITNGKEDQLVAAQFVDMQWHRATILKKEDEGYHVFFIDYGNTFTVSNISELPEDLKILPPLAYQLRLKKPEGILEWTEEMEKQFALFKELNSQPLVILTHPTGCVSLMVNDINVYNKFTTLSLDNTHSTFVYVSYCESPSKFYVQFTSTVESQKTIIETLENADDFNDTKDLKVGDLVCAKFPEDGLWYRSKILELDPEISVMFIDFGSSSVVVETKELPAEMKDIEPLAKQCCLEPPQTETGWSAEASSYFLAMSSSPFTLKIIEENECSTVDLFIDGNSVTQDLLELCPMSVKIPESMFPSEDYDIDDDDVMMEEALFLAEEERRSRNKNSYNKILCNGISDLTLEEEECPAKNIILNTNRVNRKPSDVVIKEDTNAVQKKEVFRAEQAPSETKEDTVEVIQESNVNAEHNVKSQEMETEVYVETKPVSEGTKDKEQETEIKNPTDQPKDEVKDSIVKTEDEVKEDIKPEEEIKDAIKAEEEVKEDNKAEEEIKDAIKPEEEIKDAIKPEKEIKDAIKAEEEIKDDNKREVYKESSNVAEEDIKEEISINDEVAQIEIDVNKTENEKQSNDEKITDIVNKVPSDLPDTEKTPIKDESETAKSIVPKEEDEAVPCQNKVENKTDIDGTLKQENPSDSSGAKETGATNDSKIEPSIEK